MRFEKLFARRKLLMGAAIVMVFLYHSKGLWPESPVKTVASFFYGAVDIFFFASGVGCWFSYTDRRSTADWFRRRARRILPVYLPFILVWLLLMARRGQWSILMTAGNLLSVQWLIDPDTAFNWYVTGLWLSYLLTPLLARLAAWAKGPARGALVTGALLALSVTCWGHHSLIIIAARLPIFFIGLWFAAESRRREALTRWETVLSLALIPVGVALLWRWAGRYPDLLWDRALYWYPFLLIVPGGVILAASLADALDCSAVGRAATGAFAWLGGCTFEIYLVHLALEGSGWGVYVFGTALGAAALHLAAKGLLSLCRPRLREAAASDGTGR